MCESVTDESWFAGYMICLPRFVRGHKINSVNLRTKGVYKRNNNFLRHKWTIIRRPACSLYRFVILRNQDGRIAAGESCLKSPCSAHSSEIGCNIPANSTLPRALAIYKIPQILSLSSRKNSSRLSSTLLLARILNCLHIPVLKHLKGYIFLLLFSFRSLSFPSFSLFSGSNVFIPRHAYAIYNHS